MNPLLAMLQGPGLDTQLGQKPQGLHWGSYPTYASLGYENLPNYTMPNLNGMYDWQENPESFPMTGARNPAQLQNYVGGREAGVPEPDLMPPGSNRRWVSDPEQQTYQYDMPVDGHPNVALGVPWDPRWASISPQMQQMMQPSGGAGIVPGQAQMGPAPGPTYPIFQALAKMLGLGG